MRRSRNEARIPEDTIERDRSQFLALRRLQAQSRGKSYHDKQVIDHARIEWDRHKQVERKRRARTQSIDSMIREPSSPDPIAAFDMLDQAMSLLNRLPDYERSVVSMLYLSGFSRAQVAAALKTSARNIARIRFEALKHLRSAMSPGMFP